MHKNKQSIDPLPFDELLALHQAGKLDDYAEQITREFIAQCAGSQERTQRLHGLALKLTAIRARHPTGLKAYLEINSLLQGCRNEFLDRIEEIIQGSSQTPEHTKRAKLLKFPTQPKPTLNSAR